MLFRSSWDSSIQRIDDNLLLSGEILEQQKQNFPQLSAESKQVLEISLASKEIIQRMENSTQKWSEDLKNLQKDLGLILRKSNTEKWILRGVVALLVAERVYNLKTGKTLFLF